APIVATAIAHWAAAGATADQLALLYNTQIHIADLPDSGYLGNTDASGITVDTNGAGWGWFVDPTPTEDSEFGALQAATAAVATGGDAAGHIDLLTVVEHELGHIIGLPDTDAGVMNVALDLGTRRLPDAVDVAQAAESALPTAAQAAAGTPVIAGT